MAEIITKELLQNKAQAKLQEGFIPDAQNLIDFHEPVLRGKSGVFSDEQTFKSLTNQEKNYLPVSSKYGAGRSALDAPQPSAVRGGKLMTARDMWADGIFHDPKASANSLLNDWQTLWDALRIDISVRKQANEKVRQYIYNVVSMPNSDRIFNSTEFFPYAINFEENNGEGQPVAQGESLGGQYEPITHKIYTAGFTWTLLAELFDRSLDIQKLSDAVLVGETAKKDDLAISPILNASYAGSSATAAAALTGAGRQELLYLTLENAIDDLSDRKDPITDEKISAFDLVILAHPKDASHIQRVVSGLPSTNEKNYPALSEISRVIGYGDQVIQGRIGSTTYAGVPSGTAYLIKPNRYMNIGQKRDLVMEVDRTPDVRTLARESRSWYFVEGIQSTGIDHFVQKITLPAW